MPFFVHPRTSRRDKSKASWEHELRNRFWSLEADKPHLVDWLPGDCRNCSAPVLEVQVVRCSYCEKFAFPKLVFFCGCSNCGGSGRAMALWLLHIDEVHAEVRAGSSSAPRSPPAPRR